MCSAKKYVPLIFKVVYGDPEGCHVDWSQLLKRMLRDTACNLNKCKFHTTPKTGASDGQTTGTSPCGLTIGSMILWSWGLLFTTQQRGRFISRRISLGWLATLINMPQSRQQQHQSLRSSWGIHLRPTIFSYLKGNIWKTSLTCPLITGSTGIPASHSVRDQWLTTMAIAGGNGPLAPHMRHFIPADAHWSIRGWPSEKAYKNCAGVGRYFCLASPPSAAMAAVIVVLTVVFVARPSSSSCPSLAGCHRPLPHSFICVGSSLLCPLTRWLLPRWPCCHIGQCVFDIDAAPPPTTIALMRKRWSKTPSSTSMPSLLSLSLSFNSLTAMVMAVHERPVHERPLFIELLRWLVTLLIFVRC